jgi:hypothetical protein
MAAPFAELIKWAKDAKKKGSDVNANMAVNQICDWDCGDGNEYTDPTYSEVAEFLTTFGAYIQDETKKDGLSKDVHKSGQRLEAIDSIKKWISANPRSVFTGINPAPFAFKLALRARKPQLIQQNGSRMCGPVGLLATYGKFDPKGFAQLGMNLLSAGQGSFKNLVLQPGTHILHGFPTQKASLPSVDYVLLVSLRKCCDVGSLGSMGNVHNETTTAGSLCQMLADAGYTDVQDHTFLDHGGGFFEPGPKLIEMAQNALQQKVFYADRAPKAKGEEARKKNLQKAASELQSGRFVLIQSHGDISIYVRDGGTFGITNFTNAMSRTLNRHWTAARKIEFRQNDQQVFLRLVTWGGRYDREIAWADFHPRYEGYVSAKP